MTEPIDRADPARIDRLVLFLGPYRNLTTLTAGVFALHPECQVLNHGKGHVFRSHDENFLLTDRPDAVDGFVERALTLSAGGTRGDAGGSITHSHAFDHPAMRDAYRARYGDAVSKPGARCLVWKESQRTSNALRKHAVDLDALFDRIPGLRFVTPIRNPLDCARSNKKTGHHDLLRTRTDDSTEAIIDAILDEHAWSLARESEHPERFAHFFEGDTPRETFARLAALIGIAPDARWLDDAAQCFTLKPGYDHPPTLRAHYRACVERRFDRFPEARDRLLAWG